MNQIIATTILIVDDDPEIRSSLKQVLQKVGYRILLAEDGRVALDLLELETVDVIFADVKMPAMSGIEFLKKVKAEYHDLEIVLVTGYGTIEMAVEAMREGAYDFITKPFKRHTILNVITKAIEKKNLVLENRYLKEQLALNERPRRIIGQSSALKSIMSLVSRVAPIDSTVLINGESGTGKELIARAVHQQSPRRNHRFVAVNCGALAENLLESELFGHVRGSFTGAYRDKDGLFKIASQGTLFLDEIGNISLNLQVKLLRALEEKEILPVGGTRPIPINVRIIAASNRDLNQEVLEGRFREDLYYRVNVLSIDLPPLRERKEDIPLLVQHFIKYHNLNLKKKIEGIDEEALNALLNYQWKGNIRELDNVLERAMILCDEPIITVKYLPVNLMSATTTTKPATTLKDSLREYERKYILSILKRVGNDKLKAAQILGLSQSTLYRKMSELNITEVYFS